MPSMPSPASAFLTYKLVPAPAEDTCLGFINTRYWRGSPQPTETLAGWPELLAWCGQSLGVDAAQQRALTDWAQAQPQAAAHLFELALAMREVLWRVFGALTGGAAVAEPDLAALNQALAEAPPRGELARDAASGAFVWRVAAGAPSMPALLAPVLWSAADLITRATRVEKSGRIRQCANPKCLYLFIDASKGGTRRWCDMNSCGNRAKAARHYHRSKQA